MSVPAVSPSAAPDGHDSALSSPQSAAALRRLTRLAQGVLLLGVVASAALIVSLVAGARADADLRATGVHTSGTVLRVEPDRKEQPGGVDVLIHHRDVDQTVHVRLGDAADAYVPGQTVDVVRDPVDLDHITLDDVPWTPPGLALTQGLLLVPVLLGLILGSLLLWVQTRTRRLLAGRVWTRVGVSLIRGQGRLFLVQDVGVWQSYVIGRWPRSASADEQMAWWVTDGRRAVFSPDQGGPLVLTRRR